MVRWARLAGVFALLLAMVGLGAAGGLFLAENLGWVPIDVPMWLTPIFGAGALEVWLPGLLGGWVLAVVTTVALILGSAIYVWRRRQSEALISRLERELAALRNLPFTQPAPLEDLPDDPGTFEPDATEPWPR